jgi:hypothetical protein
MALVRQLVILLLIPLEPEGAGATVTLAVPHFEASAPLTTYPVQLKL